LTVKAVVKIKTSDKIKLESLIDQRMMGELGSPGAKRGLERDLLSNVGKQHIWTENRNDVQKQHDRLGQCF
jgi:hypothetical protein